MEERRDRRVQGAAAGGEEEVSGGGGLGRWRSATHARATEGRRPMERGTWGRELGSDKAWWWGRQEEGWQRLQKGAPLGKA